MLLISPPEAFSFAEPREKGDVSSFEELLVSAVNGWSGDVTEGKKVSDWIQIGSLVSEI
jgi:hypothetical protein